MPPIARPPAENNDTHPARRSLSQLFSQPKSEPIEGKRRFQFGGEQFVPADASCRSSVGGRAGLECNGISKPRVAASGSAKAEKSADVGMPISGTYTVPPDDALHRLRRSRLDFDISDPVRLAPSVSGACGQVHRPATTASPHVNDMSIAPGADASCAPHPITFASEAWAPATSS